MAIPTPRFPRVGGDRPVLAAEWDGDQGSPAWAGIDRTGRPRLRFPRVGGDRPLRIATTLLRCHRFPRVGGDRPRDFPRRG